MGQHIPKRLNLKMITGEESVMDVGKDAVVTVLIRGPNVNLKFEGVRELAISYLEIFADENS